MMVIDGGYQWSWPRHITPGTGPAAESAMSIWRRESRVATRRDDSTPAHRVPFGDAGAPVWRHENQAMLRARDSAMNRAAASRHFVIDA